MVVAAAAAAAGLSAGLAAGGVGVGRVVSEPGAVVLKSELGFAVEEHPQIVVA